MPDQHKTTFSIKSQNNPTSKAYPLQNKSRNTLKIYFLIIAYLINLVD